MKVASPYGLDTLQWNRYLQLIRRIARYDPNEKSWVLDEDKAYSISREEFEDIARELSKLGVKEDILAWYSSLPPIKAEFSGNYVKIRSKYGVQHLINKLHPVLSYRIRRFNPTIRMYEEEVVARYWVYNSSISTFRGLFPVIQRVLGDVTARYLGGEHRVQHLENYEARLYQIAAVTAAIRQIEKCGAATIQAATGSGKTVMAIMAWRAMGRPKTFFLSLNTDLLLQARDFFSRAGERDLGLVMHGKREYGARVVFATVQTLYRAIKQLEEIDDSGFKTEWDSELMRERKFDWVDLKTEEARRLLDEFRNSKMVIFDEVQHIPARTVFTTVMESPNSVRLGLSATPWRDDGRDLDIYGLVGAVAAVIKSSDLIDKGYLVPAHIFIAEYEHPYYYEDWNRVKSRVINDYDRALWIAKWVKRLPKPAMVLVREIKQGMLQRKAIIDAGVEKTVFIYGDVPPSRRKEILDAVRSRRIDVLVATTLADEGLDIPELRSLVLAGGGKSSTRALQRVGRVVRPAEGKTEGVVVDICDMTKYFRDHCERRIKIYRTEPKWRIERV